MLHDRLAAYLAYFERLATQPPNRWEGFDLTRRETRNFGLRFQIAFPCYALGALCCHPTAEPADQARCRAAMAALIERMIQRRVWAYWSAEAERRGLARDPIDAANLHYSGHLAMMIGVYEAAGGDQRYDEPFTLLWHSDVRYPYTHTTLVETLARRMRAHAWPGVEAAPGRVVVHAMSHLLWALTLHAALHASDWSAQCDAWLAFLQQRLLLRGPHLPGRGAFSSSFLPRLRLAVPVSLNYVDAWGLALLAGVAPDLTREVAPRLLARVRRRAGPEGAAFAYAPSAALWRSLEMADPATTTGFSYLLAVELGAEEQAAELLAYADAHCQPAVDGAERVYAGGLAAPIITALFALGEAGGLRTLRATARPVALTGMVHGADDTLQT